MADPILYVVPTPIGNLKDITLRALEILQSVDIVVCEDTRHTRKLLTHYHISRPMVSCERFSESRRASVILEHLASGKSLALVSDAGTPGVSDPGAKIIHRVRSHGYRVEALPGPSALTTALCASGFEPPLRFIGFFPRTRGAMNSEIMKMEITADVTIFYESPRRLMTTLIMIRDRMPDREMCVARELTKIHEEYLTGTAGQVISRIENGVVRGEVTVLVRGVSQQKEADHQTLSDRIDDLLKSGCSIKDITGALSQETGAKRNDIYRMILDMKKTLK